MKRETTEKMTLPGGYVAPFQTVEAAATLTGLSKDYLYKGIKADAVPHIRSGRLVLVDVPALIEQTREERRRRKEREAQRPVFVPFELQRAIEQARKDSEAGAGAAYVVYKPGFAAAVVADSDRLAAFVGAGYDVAARCVAGVAYMATGLQEGGANGGGNSI